MRYIIKEHYINIPDKALLEDVRKSAKILGKNAITYLDYCIAGKYSSQTVARRFGSWNKALEKAGLKLNIRRKYTNPDLLKNLKHVWDSLGRQPLFHEVRRPFSLYHAKVYVRRFGSWNKTLRAFQKFAGEKNAVYKIKERKIRLLKRRLRRSLFKPVSDLMRFEIFKRDYYKCRICGRSPASDPKIILHADHVIPKSKGGKTEPGNLQTLCSRCNKGKSDRLMYK